MTKALQIVIYKSINDDEKVAAYAKLAASAMAETGARALARGIPAHVVEEGEFTRTVVVEWDSIEAAKAFYDSPEYQEALAVLGDAAVRDFRYIEMV